eukprot:6202246-Pleurochrysis_carterae.AAC.1
MLQPHARLHRRRRLLQPAQVLLRRSAHGCAPSADAPRACRQRGPSEWRSSERRALRAMERVSTPVVERQCYWCRIPNPSDKCVWLG